VGPRAPLALTMAGMHPPRSGETWVGLSDESLPLGAAADWAVRPGCGAVVLFNGTARDHSPGREGVHRLEYEAYEEQVAPRLEAVATEARARWASIGRIAMLHRTGLVPIGESAVVVAVSAPHRDDAFAAARFCIDALKASVPIWKRESWDGGESWGLEAQHVVDPSEVEAEVHQ
jgi:molybdopterin synthase catalytic subunit